MSVALFGAAVAAVHVAEHALAEIGVEFGREQSSEFLDIFRQVDLPVNFHLQRAIRRAYLRATWLLCYDFSELNKWHFYPFDTPPNDPSEVRANQRIMEWAAKELEKVDQDDWQPDSDELVSDPHLLTLVGRGETESLEGTFRSEMLYRLFSEVRPCFGRPLSEADKWPLMAAEGWTRPIDFQGDAPNTDSEACDWFDLFRHCFSEELNKNAAAQNTFVNRMLAELLANSGLDRAALPGLISNSIREWYRSDLVPALVVLGAKVEQIRQIQERIEPKIDETLDVVREIKSSMKDSQPVLTPQALSEAKKKYLRHIKKLTRDLPLGGLDDSLSDASSNAEPLKLDDIFIAMEVRSIETNEDILEHRDIRDSKMHERPQSLPAIEAFGMKRRAVLLGDPGSGKSTLVNYLVHCIASKQLDDRFVTAKRLEGLDESWLTKIPVRIELRRMAAWIRSSEVPTGDLSLLKAYLKHWMEHPDNEDYDHSKLVNYIHDELDNGRILLLLDGWDEVALDEKAHPRIRKMLKELPELLPDCLILLTCRVGSWNEQMDDLQPWRLDSRVWPILHLCDFDEDRIERFIDVWFHEIKNSRGNDRSDELARTLKRAVKRDDLKRVAGKPMLLTLMAIVHAHKELPEWRSAIYDEVVDLLLRRWQKEKVCDQTDDVTLQDLLAKKGRTIGDLKIVLSEAAFQAHGKMSVDIGPEATADISESLLLDRLTKLCKDGRVAIDVLETIKLKAGLLKRSGANSLTFPHRTFQEFLAAGYLCSEEETAKEVAGAAEKGAIWHEVALLAVNFLVHSSRLSTAVSVVRRLSRSDVFQGEVQCRNVIMAAECMCEIGVSRVEEDDNDPESVSRVRESLTNILKHGLLPVTERVRAGSVLAAIGDFRDFEAKIAIPDCTFKMGDDALHNSPSHPEKLSAFEIGKYPVTNRQYWDFIKESGGEAPRHWRDGSPDPLKLNHPVTNVSWHDAKAYCAWVSKQQGINCRLPTEAEWERAAQGPSGRKFPWGDTFDPERCRCSSETWGDSGGTSPVGCFLNGASEEGCLDMAGNVWEWCENWYDENEQLRVLRGGSWYFIDPFFFRAAYRDYVVPDDSYDLIGFRCVVRSDLT